MKFVKFANNFTKLVEFANDFMKFSEFVKNCMKFVGLANNFYEVRRKLPTTLKVFETCQ